MTMDAFREIMDTFSQWTIPLVMLIIILWGAKKKVPMYESFVTGAKEGFDVAVMIIPYHTWWPFYSSSRSSSPAVYLTT